MARTLRVEIIGDASSYSRALGTAANQGSKFGSALKTLGKVAVGAGLAIGAGFVATLKVGFDELAEGQKVAAQTAAVIKSTGGAANVAARDVSSLAESLSEMSGIDDEVIQGGENMLLTFTNIRNEVGRGNDIFNQATKTLLDMSVALGQDMQKSAIQLGKALNDPIKGLTALQRVGVSFTESQKETIKAMVESGNVMGAQKVILAELNKEFGGSAKAFGETMPGQLAKLRNAFEELAGKLAANLLPVLNRVLRSVNENWPQIEKVATAAMKGLVSAIGSAIGLVQRHFGTIKAVVTTAFSGAKTVIQTFVSFMGTSFGQQMAAAAAAVFVFGRAFVAIRTGVTLASTALSALRTNPFFLALIPIAAGIGILAQRFIEGKIKAELFAASLQRAGGSADALKASLDRLNQSETALESSKLALISANRQAEAAEKAWRTAVEESGAGTKKAQEAYLLYRQALNEVQSAQDGLKAATKENTAAEAERTAELARGVEKIRELTAGVSDMAAGTQAAQYAAAGFRDQMKTLGEQARQTAVEVRKTDPAAAAASTKLAQLAQIASDLSIKLGRVPKSREIIAEAKLRGLGPFLAGIGEIPKSTEKAKTETQKDMAGVTGAVSSQVGPARSAAFSLGASIVGGVVSGLNSRLAELRATVQQIGQAAIQAMRFSVGAKSPATKFIPIGQDIVQGLIVGIDTKTPELKGKMKALMSGDVLAEIGRASKILGASAVKEMIAGFLGLEPSAKAQLKRMLREATKEATLAAAQAVKENKQAFADAWASLGDAATQALTKKFEDWVPPSTLKLAAMDLQDQLAALDEQLRASDEAMAKAVESAAGFSSELEQIDRAAQLLASGAGMDAVVDALPAALEEALAGVSPEEAAAKLEEMRKTALEKLNQANQEILAAKKAHEEAIRAQLRFDLQQQAIIEQQEHDKKMAQMTKNLAAELAEIQKWLTEHPKQWKAAQDKIIKLLAEYGVNYFEVGKALGNEFAKGLRDALGEVRSAAAALAAAGTPGGGGGGAGRGGGGARAEEPQGRQHGGPVRQGFPYIVGEAGPELFIPQMAGKIVPPRERRFTGTVRGGKGFEVPSGATTEVNVHFHGTVIGGSTQEIARALAPEIEQALTRNKQRNGALTFEH